MNRPFTTMIVGAMLVLLIECVIFGGLLTAITGCGCVPGWLVGANILAIVTTIALVWHLSLQYERDNEDKPTNVR